MSLLESFKDLQASLLGNTLTSQGSTCEKDPLEQWSGTGLLRESVELTKVHLLSSREVEEEKYIQEASDPESRLLTLDDLFIRTKERELIRLAPNEIQSRYLDLVLPKWREGLTSIRGLREVLLKARQQGLSTIILALIFEDTINTPRTNSVVVAHDADTTQKLFRIIKRYYDHLPEEKKPRTQYASKTEFYWPDIDSSFYVGTAGARDFGRSGTINNAHCTEVAMWPDAEQLVAGLFQAVPRDGNIFVESTAKGIGNYFHKEWELAKRKKSALSPRFFAWFETPEYREEVPSDFLRTKEEDRLAEAYDLGDDQLQWRRTKVKELKGRFPQEYPANDVEAFLASGTPVFDNILLNEMLGECETPLFRANFEHFKNNVHEDFKAVLESLRGGTPHQEISVIEDEEEFDLEIYELPEAGAEYVIGADVAEGLNPAGNPDFGSAHVLHAKTWDEVAHVHGRWNTREFGMMLAHLHRFYNRALLAPERNTHGEALLNTLMHEAGLPLATDHDPKGIYCHREFDERKIKKEITLKPGWPTTRKTKALCLDELAADVSTRETTLRSKATIGEMMRFVHLAGGKMGGESGCHDDRVISRAIAQALLNRRPRTRTLTWEAS